MLQRDVARQVGVDPATVTNWELNRCAPDLRKMPGVIRFLGYLPDPDDTSPGQRLRAARRARGLSIKEVARAVGVDPGTVARWESGKSQPAIRQDIRLKEVLRAQAGSETLSPNTETC
jgi:transcriptional regulator with XRE-family HTH domain